MASKNNCTSWPDAKKDQLGCGVSCDCPRVRDNLQSYDWVVAQSSLWDAGKIGLHDIDAKSFSLINYFSIEKSNIQEERRRIAEEVKGLLGG
jgi:hypothetical protein